MTMQVQFGFTPAEREVWALRFLGHTPDSISSILNIEKRTVDIHLKQCLTKCQQHIGDEAKQQPKEMDSKANAKSNINHAQQKYAPVVVAPVPEFAAFYL